MKKHYQTNIPSWIMPETASHLQDIIARLVDQHEDSILGIVLYGSFARHEARPLDDRDPSDLDLLILVNTDEEITGADYHAVFHSLGLAHQQHLDDPQEIVVMLGTRHMREWDAMFVENIMRDGIVLYTSNNRYPSLRQLVTTADQAP